MIGKYVTVSVGNSEDVNSWHVDAVAYGAAGALPHSRRRGIDTLLLDALAARTLAEVLAAGMSYVSVSTK